MAWTFKTESHIRTKQEHKSQAVKLALAFLASSIAELLNYLLYVDAHTLRG
jgi:hypothetical protein